jgi:uncharacterized protein
MSATPREVLARMHELTLTDDKAVVDLYAEDGAHELPFAPPGAPRRIEGREALRALMNAQSGRSPVTYEGFENLTVWETTDPEVIIAEYEIAGTGADGAGFRIPQLLVLRVRDGRIALTRSYLNPAQLAALMS